MSTPSASAFREPAVGVECGEWLMVSGNETQRCGHRDSAWYDFGELAKFSTFRRADDLCCFVRVTLRLSVANLKNGSQIRRADPGTRTRSLNQSHRFPPLAVDFAQRRDYQYRVLSISSIQEGYSQPIL